MAGDPGRFEHRPVRITAAEQGPVGHHQVHLHRLHLTGRPPRQQRQRGVRGDRTHPTPTRALLSTRATTTARERACRAANAPTTSLSGPSTHRYAIPSGAGRTVTRRDRTAASIRRTTLPASSSAATRAAAAPAALTPSPPSNGPTRASTTPRSCTLNVAVAWTTATATRSLHTPADNAAIVRGISCTNARANPTNRSPKLGDSRRANATTDPTDRATSRGSTTSREHRTASVARA